MRRVWLARAALVLPTLAIVAAAAAINLWAVAHPLRIDLTSGGVYSIGPQTQQVLKALHEPVQVTFFYDLRSSPPKARTRCSLCRAPRAGNTRRTTCAPASGISGPAGTT